MNGVKAMFNVGPPLWAWVRVAAVAATVAGAWFSMEARVNAALGEAKSAKAELAKIQFEIREEHRRMLTVLGALQLDMSQLCAATFGPEACYTTGKGRGRE